MDEKLNIFDVFKQINVKNYNYLNTLPETLRNQFSSYLTFRWMLGTDNPEQLMLLGEYVNDKVLKLSNHPNLLYKLYCTTSCDRNTRYSWIYPKKDSSAQIKIIAEYLSCSHRVAKLHLPSFTHDDVIEMAKDLGYQDAEIKKLL